MTVTVDPNRANSDANSMPTAPAPITTRLFGISFSSRMWSEVRIDLPSGVIPGRLRGADPVARRTDLVLSFFSSFSPLTTTLPAPSSRACPLKRAILFFVNR